MPKPDPNDPAFLATVAERERLVALLRDLTSEQWAHPSLCDGWRVREVVAHMTSMYRDSLWRLVRGMVAARGSYNRYAARAALQDTARLSDGELLESMAANTRHPWRPPGGGQAGALSHDVIHGLDITEALGLPGPPVEALRIELDGVKPRNVKFFGVDLAGTRLVATDTDWSLGEGTPHRATAKELLLTITGRRALA